MKTCGTWSLHPVALLISQKASKLGAWGFWVGGSYKNCAFCSKLDLILSVVACERRRVRWVRLESLQRGLWRLICRLWFRYAVWNPTGFCLISLKHLFSASICIELYWVRKKVFVFGGDWWRSGSLCFLQIQELIRGAKNAVSLAQVCFATSNVMLL